MSQIAVNRNYSQQLFSVISEKKNHYFLLDILLNKKIQQIHGGILFMRARDVIMATALGKKQSKEH